MFALSIVPLTKAGFAPFGEVVETGDVKPRLINEGFAERFDDLASIDVAAEGGEVNVSLFIGSARRKGAGSNLEEKWLEAANWLYVAPDGAAKANADIASKRG